MKNIICFWLIIQSMAFAQDVQFFKSNWMADSFVPLSWYCPNTHRLPIDLNGEWEFQIGEKGSWRKVHVPSISEYEGELTYRKVFQIDSSFQSHNFKLIVYAINYSCKIFINQKFLGSHAGGHNSFSMDIPANHLKIGGSNFIEIKVDTKLDSRQTIPLKHQLLGQKNFGGIIRNIYLLALPKNAIKLNAVQYQFKNNYDEAVLQLSLHIHNNDSPNLPLQTSTKEPKFTCIVELKEKESSYPVVKQKIGLEKDEITHPFDAEFTLQKPRLWSPENPHLYFLNIYLIEGNQIVDLFQHRLGIKDLEYKDNDMYLNGNRLVLKGIDWYEDYWTEPLQIITYIKELNANAVRIVNKPPHPYFVYLCDLHGIFILEEIPLFWIPTAIINSDQYFIRASDYLTETIQRDKLNVSVLAWGIAGPFHPASVEFVNKLYDLAKQLDDRAIYLSGDQEIIRNILFPPQIACVDVFDWDPKNLNYFIEKNKQSLMFIKSFGSAIQEDTSAIHDPVIFQEAQTLKIVEAWQIIQNFKEIDGYFLKSLVDWKCEYPLAQYGQRKDSYIVRSGLMDSDSNKRLSYNSVKSIYSGNRARINLAATIQKDKPGIFPLIGILSLFIFLFIYNTRRYFQDNIKRIFIHPHGFYVDLRDKRKIPISHTLIVAIFLAIGLGLVGATFFYFYKEHPFFDHVLTLISMNDSMKQNLIKLCWNPEIAILLLSVTVLFLFVILAIFIKLFAVIFQKKYPISQALTLVFWIGANYLLLVPIGMILYRVLMARPTFMPVLFLLVLINLWFLGRLIKAIKVTYLWTTPKAAIFLICFIGIVVFGWIYFYQRNEALLEYLHFYMSYIKG